jgi:putative tryptophan/tyrosine transport system substrate-binding protein
MKRREFIALICGAFSAFPLAARAQQQSPLIGILQGASPGGAYTQFLARFFDGLRETGYVERQNVGVEYRWAEGVVERLPALADQLVRRRATVIVASGGDAPALAAKNATNTIPIVFISGGEPVKTGLVASLNRPGGNVTGVNFISSELIPKRLGLLHDLIAKATTVGALVNPNYSASVDQRRELQEAAAATGLELQIVTATTAGEIDAAFAGLANRHIGALLLANDPFFQAYRLQIVSLAARYGIAVSYSDRQFVDAGGLISYGPDIADAYHLAGTYTGRVLNGTSPADLPVQQPTKFELAINAKTAKTLGIDIPSNIVAIADEVIE